MRKIAPITELMKSKHGLDISMYESSFILKSVEKRINLLNLKDVDDFADLLSKDKDEANALFSSLNICYSEFFRNPLTFTLLEQIILPRIIEEKPESSEIRIWSAGCAAGQEAYSIAMILDDHIRRKEKATRFRIFGTDISNRAIETAREGVYNASEVQNMSLRMISQYFTRQGESYAVSENLKDCIDFSHDDLLDPRSVSPSKSIYGDFDLICCSNILFYYKPEIRQIILRKLYISLSPKGFLISGEAEREIIAKFKFRTVVPPAAVFQKIR
jgi:chemotaxis methyl-accepting protein methylase